MKRVAFGLLIAMLVAASLILFFSKTSYATQDRDHIAESASRLHWSGTDELGRDRTVRLAGALLLGLAGAVSASLLATSLAVGVGAAAAFVPSAFSACLLFLSDVFLTLPWLFLLMMVRSALPLTMAPIHSAAVTFLLLGLLVWPAYARITYARTAAVRNSDAMIHGRACGLTPWQLAKCHILPHLLPLATAQFLILVPTCVIAEANLGTLGLGVSEPLPSWGSMLLELQHTSALAGSTLVFLPIVLLIVVLFLMELLVVEV